MALRRTFLFFSTVAVCTALCTYRLAGYDYKRNPKVYSLLMSRVLRNGFVNLE
ncbi:hypothetical protein L228DRAFT_249611 [Xylona heveae TC161]|uniref:Uncharacterized protein n=1 Tax=Xylona heveae (strain CBS 132557 / TC161) TaxID=1328760 RepID=A0A165FBR2_XYLHT|nr:hypothetical protein L228DRAFT_249611 [Xylona heveae TC161]KZF20794.1 hypothetical protein L228DRAFT_249611 [Xylona heveae TC161]